MKKILVIIAIYLINTIPALAEKNDCSGMKKLSKEYIICTTENIKKAANKKNQQIKEGSAKKTEQVMLKEELHSHKDTKQKVRKIRKKK